ncbi:MAG: flavin reductase family protein [Magnetococcales bacterium]|nr:flavin reductase family protein [Magnetococcales bacterium]
MEIDLRGLSANQVYHHMNQTLVPRPIAWVLTENASGSLNLAPFSYFNGVSSDPPLIMLAIGLKSDGTPKDTRANILARRDFVVHIPSWEHMEWVNDSSASLPEGVSEVEKLALETRPFPGCRLPRLATCRVAYGCQFHDQQVIGPESMAMILGRVETIYLDDTIASRDAKGRLQVDTQGIDPLARLGRGEFARLGEHRPLGRPRLGG